MLKVITFFLCTFILSISSVYPQNINVKLTEELILGDDENASQEYLFNRITQICTDSQNNIYVAEDKMLKIRVFDECGKFIKSIGRRGQGPGEMLEITCMTIDHNDDVIVVDRLNRRFTRFSNLGEETVTFSFLSSINPDIFAILPIRQNSYLLYFRKKSDTNSHIQPDNRILHIMNHNFSKIQESFAQAKDIWNFDEPFLRSLVGAPLFIGLLAIDSTKIIFTPFFNEGKLIPYNYRNETWNPKILQGMERKYKSYKLLNRKDYKNYKYPRYSFSYSGSAGRFLVKTQNLNRGLCVLNDGKIVHFSFSSYKNNEKYYCKMFDENVKFIGSCALKEKRFEIMWIDNKNRLYARSVSKDGYPVIKVLKFDYSIKK